MKVAKNTKKRAVDKVPDRGRGEKTRRVIIDAAKKVFSAHPYDAASIRMIAEQGGFYHGLIRYHFPNKAAIFETVLEEVNQDLLNANKEWLSEISTLSTKKALALYLDRIIEYFQIKPEVFRITVQNVSQDDPASLPGYRHMVNHGINSQRQYENTFKMFPQDRIRSFIAAFNVLGLNFLGADKFYAEIQGLAPGSDEYLQWVKETMMSIFLPLFKSIPPSQ